MHYASPFPPIHEDQYFRSRTIGELEDLNRHFRQLKDEVLAIKGWLSPKPVERSVKGLTFGEALVWLKEGKRITRKCWNNQKVHVWLWHGAASQNEEAWLAELRVKTVQGKTAPWMPNHQELLAEDWEVVK